jgi:hypothetical protein
VEFNFSNSTSLLHGVSINETAAGALFRSYIKAVTEIERQQHFCCCAVLLWSLNFLMSMVFLIFRAPYKAHLDEA